MIELELEKTMNLNTAVGDEFYKNALDSLEKKKELDENVKMPIYDPSKKLNEIHKQMVKANCERIIPSPLSKLNT
jgi:hypothetical protein